MIVVSKYELRELTMPKLNLKLKFKKKETKEPVNPQQTNQANPNNPTELKAKTPTPNITIKIVIEDNF